MPAFIFLLAEWITLWINENGKKEIHGEAWPKNVEKKRSKWWMNGVFIWPPHPTASNHHRTVHHSLLLLLATNNEQNVIFFICPWWRCIRQRVKETRKWNQMNFLSLNHDEMMIFYFQHLLLCLAHSHFAMSFLFFYYRMKMLQVGIFDKFRVPFHIPFADVIDIVVSHSFSQCWTFIFFH